MMGAEKNGNPPLSHLRLFLSVSGSWSDSELPKVVSIFMNCFFFIVNVARCLNTNPVAFCLTFSTANIRTRLEQH